MTPQTEAELKPPGVPRPGLPGAARLV